jgi:beta-glucosidase-like glycosyl hydrolase
MWPIFAGTVLIHVTYKVLQAMAYMRGAYTVVYPVVRGTGPLVTVLIAGVVFAEVYAPAFQECVEGGRASAAMCSYNAINGVPACANAFLMNDVLRGEWSFDGYLTSDCGAVTNILDQHQYTRNVSATFGATLPAGMDIGCDMMLVAPGAAAAAIAAGDIAEADIDAALAHLFRVRFRLGEFDAAADQPYTKIGLETVCSDAHVALARESARQGIVLLSNPAGRLPLARAATASVAVIGPLGNSSRAINGGINYADIPCGGAATTLVEALAAAGVAVTFNAGCDDGVACGSTAGFAAATAAAAAADAALVVVGLDETIEDEALDRVALTLPGAQAALVAAACGAAKVCAVVIMSGGAVDLSSAEPAISGGLFVAGFLGGSGAPALVDTLFGISSPAGRLSQTVYAQNFTAAVSMFEMGVRPGVSAFPPFTTPGRTHMFYQDAPVYPFGHGLSYTTWRVTLDGPARVSLAPTAALLAARPAHGARFAPRGADAATYRVNVTNTGARAIFQIRRDAILQVELDGIGRAL